MDLRDRQAHLAEQIAEQMGNVQKHARPWRSIIAAVMATLAAVGSATVRGLAQEKAAGHYVHQHRMWLLIAAGAALVFTVTAASATLGLSKKAKEMFRPRIGYSHATLVRVVLVLVGWATILTITLDLFGISVERILLGGAFTGVLLGIAAQQTLANLFAGIVLLLAKPFHVGDEIKLTSGPLGGSFEGQVVEVGLTYVRLETGDGMIHLPNAQVLSAAASPRTRPEAEAAPEAEPRHVPVTGDGSDGLPHPPGTIKP